MNLLIFHELLQSNSNFNSCVGPRPEQFTISPRPFRPGPGKPGQARGLFGFFHFFKGISQVKKIS
jgi:hypothetical protein